MALHFKGAIASSLSYLIARHILCQLIPVPVTHTLEEHPERGGVAFRFAVVQSICESSFPGAFVRGRWNTETTVGRCEAVQRNGFIRRYWDSFQGSTQYPCGKWPCWTAKFVTAQLKKGGGEGPRVGWGGVGEGRGRTACRARSCRVLPHVSALLGGGWGESLQL